MTLLITCETSFELKTGSGAGSRVGISARRGMTLSALLGAVLGATLPAVGHAGRVERGPDDLVAEARQILDSPAADQHDRVLLQVVPLARDVGPDLHAVGQANPGHLPEGRVRLLRGDCHHARADAPLLGSAPQGRGLRLRRRGTTALADELVHGRHSGLLSGRETGA